MLDFSIYLLYRAGTAIASALPVRVLFAIGSFMGWAPGCCSRSIAGWPGVISRSPSRRKNRRGNCGGSSAATSKFSAANLICSVKMASMPPEKLDALCRDGKSGRDASRTARGPARHHALEPHRQLGIVRTAGSALRQLRKDWDGLPKTGEPLHRPGCQPKTRRHRRRSCSIERRISQADRIASFRRADWSICAINTRATTVFGRRSSEGSPRLLRSRVCWPKERARRSSPRRFTRTGRRAGGWFSRRARLSQATR